MEPATELALLPDDPSAVEVVDAMIRRVKADLVANRRERIVSDDRNKKLRTTHLRVELHLLKQSRSWVTTDADLAWVRSGLEAWRSAYGLRQPRRLEWLAQRRGTGRAVAKRGRARPHEEDLVDADELRELLAQTTGYKIGSLLAQECAVAIIVRDPSRHGSRGRGGNRRVSLGGRCSGARRIAVVRERMRASGLIPPARDVVRGYWRTSRRSRPAAATTTSTTVTTTRTTHPVQGTPSRSGLRPSAW